MEILFFMRSDLKTNEVTEIYRLTIVGSEHVVLDFIHQSQCISWSTHISMTSVVELKLVSYELIHFGVIACLFRQIGGHSSRFVLFFSF